MSNQTTDSVVVVGVDFSKQNEAAIQYAAEEARLRGASLLLLHALDVDVTPLSFPSYTVDELEAAATRELTQVRTGLEQEWSPLVVSTSIATSSPAAALAQASTTAELVVVGSRGRGGYLELLVGSVSWRVMARATGPVILVRPDAVNRKPDTGSGPVLVGIDGSPDSQAALDFAFQEALRRKVALVAVNVWAFPDNSGLSADREWSSKQDEWQQQIKEDAQILLAEAMAGTAEQYPDVPVDRVATYGFNVAETLMQAADQQRAELIVVGAKGHHPITEMLLGAFCIQLAHHAKQSTAVVRARKN